MESFHGTLRDECLNETVFSSARQARAMLAAWRQDYNHVRPHLGPWRAPPGTGQPAAVLAAVKPAFGAAAR